MPNPGAEHWVAVAKLDPKAAAAPEEKPEARRWDQLSPAQQAGIRCAEPAFQKFINEEKRFDCISEDGAAAFVREWCDVKSRADISTNKGAAEAWGLFSTASTSIGGTHREQDQKSKRACGRRAHGKADRRPSRRH